MATPPICPACGTPAALTSGAEIWPHRPDLAGKPVWRCTVCPDARVGCHPGTEDPLGTPAGPDLRKARRLLHEQRLDPLWQTAPDCGAYPDCRTDEDRTFIRRVARGRVYGFLAERMRLTREQCHTALFTLDQCRQAWRALEGVSYPEIREWATKHRAAATPKKRKAA